MAAGAASFLVAWSSLRETPSGAFETHAIIARRIGSDGVPKTEPFVVADLTGFSELGSAAVAYDRRTREFLVAWSGARGSRGYQIWGSRLATTDTGVTTRRPFRVSMMRSGDKFRAIAPAVAADTRRGGYLVAWEGRSDRGGGLDADVFVRTVPADPAAALGRMRPISGSAAGTVGMQPAVAYNAQARQYGVIWTAGVFDERAVYARRVDPTGRPVGKSVAVDDAPPGSDAAGGDIAGSSTGGYLVGFIREATDSPSSVVVARRLTNKFAPRRVRRISTASATAARSLALAAEPRTRDYRAVWFEARDPESAEYDLFGRKIR